MIMSTTTPFTVVLPQHLQEDIVNCLEDAVHVARLKCVCKSMQYVGDHVRSLRIICKEEYHASMRDEHPTIRVPGIEDKKPSEVIGAAGDHQATSLRAPQANDLGIQKTQNDGIPAGFLPDNLKSSVTGRVECQEEDQHHDIGVSSNGNSQEKGLEAAQDGSPHGRRAPLGINGRRGTRSQREVRSSEAKICNHQQLRDGHSGNFFPNESSSSKKPRLEGHFHELDPQEAEEASHLETNKHPNTHKRHPQKPPSDDDNSGNFSNFRSSKKLKLKGKFPVEDPQAAGETSASVASNKEPTCFRQLVRNILRKTVCLAELRIEIDSNLQSKAVPELERRFTDHWLTDSLFVSKWIPSVQATIQDLCIVDYGQQAIMRRSSLLTLLSQTCFLLKTLDLRNMFLDTNGCKDMPHLTSFTLHCVKVNSDALQEINKRMTNLQTLAMLGVFGIQQGHLTLSKLKVLCLGLSTKAKSVKIELPNLVKLQLKMKCPKVLHIQAPVITYVAFNLEIRNCSLVGFENSQNLRELLFGASNFATLSKLVRQNRLLNKMFLDIPCLSLGEDGKLRGVVKEVLLNIPPFETLHSECPNMQVLNVGPGLWHVMEKADYSTLMEVHAWPPITRLILHMIPHTLAASVDVLLMFVQVLPKLQILEVKVHTNSPVDYDTFIDAIKTDVAHLNFRPGKWTRSLDFSCFSF